MRRTILFLEQQSWRSGAERVLEQVLEAIEPEFLPLVAFPEDGAFAAQVRHRNIETVFFPLGHYRSGQKSLADMIAFGPRSIRSAHHLSRVIRQRNVSLVYINSPRCLLAGVIAARLTGRPSLFHLHMTMTRWSDRLIAAQAARFATRIIACSRTSAMALAQAGVRLREKTQVVYNPVCKPRAMDDLRRSGARVSAWLASSPEMVVGQVGRITPQKGQHVLLRAAARLKSRGADIHIVFVGAPEEDNPQDTLYIRALESLVRNTGLEGKVHWAGYQEDPNSFYATFDVVVIPSTISEGLPMVALEALQWGLPVVGSRVGGIPEVVRDCVNGLLAPPGDDLALADCLERWLKDTELRSCLQAGARASLDRRFSVETFRNEIRSAVSELCSPSEEREREARGHYSPPSPSPQT